MSTRESWESLYDERLRLKAENDALKLRVAVLEKSHEQVTYERDEATAKRDELKRTAAEVDARLRRRMEGAQAERDEALKRIYRLENERDSGHWCEKERAAKHAANNRCQAVVGVCETVIKWLKRVAPGDAGMGQLMLEAALNTYDSEDPVLKERAAIVRKIRQDAQISAALVRIGGRAGLDKALNGLADEIERGEREQVVDGQG